MTVGERIKARRESLGISQVSLANSTGEKKQTLYKYEKNIVTNIPIKKLTAIAKVLGVSPAYLFGWTTKEERTRTNHFPKRLSKEPMVKPMYFDIPDHPVIRNMERTGFPSGQETPQPRCPICGAACETIYYKSRYSDIVGCDICIHKGDPYEETECFQ